MRGDSKAEGNPAFSRFGRRSDLIRPDAGDNLAGWIQRVLGAGRPLDHARRRQSESLFGRDLGGVCIHDSHMSAEMARRLGAEAFSIRNHIVGPGDKLQGPRRPVSGLLAHEVAHVIQQTDPERLMGHRLQEPEFGEGPPQFHSAIGRAAQAAGTGDAEERRPPTHVDAGLPPGRPSLSRTTPRIQLRATRSTGVSPGDREAEAEAQAAEQTVDQMEEPEADSHIQPAIQPEEIAAKVYQIMLRELMVDRERQ